MVWVGLAAVAALVVAGCGSSDDKAEKTTAPSSAPGSTATPAGAGAGVTIGTANVGGFGTVLVNAANGRTLYLLTSEQGGKRTCTDENGCTKAWPPVELPAGATAATAGSGVDASKLGTVKTEDGDLYVTYGGYPLYEFAKDAAAGDAKGQGISSFGGTWYVVSPAGTAVTTGAAPAAAPSTTAAAPPSSMGY